ncbi:peptidoglycan-binding domain-containing protein [Streptomyces sp. E5N91]|uniref:peptidoglycan-binding domain-containing protein n=1 Tax=Streptomyces sp. E5N91 TaxID=1851996 RepID=UPI00187D13BC|nr:peptidoglycan-binding domain-containing protein [Streptomyces sp. E5N91]
MAEGLLSLSDIDGRFGPDAASATRKWQSRYGLTADGWVGDATWRKADDRMYRAGLEWAEAAICNGREGSVSFVRGNSDDPGDSADGGAYEQADAPGDRLLVTVRPAPRPWAACAHGLGGCVRLSGRSAASP